MIIGAISGYNDADLLGDCFASLRSVCKRIIYVDGAYEGFPLIRRSHHSTDGSIEVAEGRGVEVIRADVKPWKTQVLKRNQYLVGKEGDWYLMLDADERLWGNLIYDEEEWGYRLAVMEMVTGRTGHWVRLFRHRSGLEYRGGHNLLFSGESRLIEEYCPILPTAGIHHHKHLRDSERNSKKEEYYLYQYELEREFRLKHKCP